MAAPVGGKDGKQGPLSSYMVPLAVGGALVLGLAVGVAALQQRKRDDRDVVARMGVVPGNPLVYMDVEDSGVPVGRIVIHVRRDVVPRAAANFVQLCTGAAGFGYAATAFHAVERDARVFGGDFYGSGSGGFSIYGDAFEDESFALGHVGSGTVAMRSFGPNTNASQFYVTLRALPQYDGVCEVIGYLVDGWEVLERMNLAAAQSRSPGRFGADHDFRIAACGLLTETEAAAYAKAPGHGVDAGQAGPGQGVPALR